MLDGRTLNMKVRSNRKCKVPSQNGQSRNDPDRGKEGEIEEKESHELALFECAHFILPWLEPADLAAMSSTCKTISRISRYVTAARSSDASRGLEKLPIPFVNAVDFHPYAYFVYMRSQILGLELHEARLSWGGIRSDFEMVHSSSSSVWVPAPVEDLCGCHCERCDEKLGCPCCELNSSDLTRECGPSCGCGWECGNRVTQTGISVRLKIMKDRRKGWGLHAGQFIHRDQFVCEYAGELLTTKEARRRQRRYDQLAWGGKFSAALLVIREHLPSGKACMRMNIDATKIGNMARFINHSCDGGNLSTILVRGSGALLPRLCFFASRDIQENEELTFSYGDIRTRSKGLQCFCGSSCCLGMLPSEHT